MRLTTLLLASAFICTAGGPATAEDNKDNNDAKVQLPKPEQTEDARKPTEPTGAEKSVPVGGELNDSTRARTREDVIRDTLRDRRSK